MSAIARSVYVSGFCGVAAHERCRGAYAGTGCSCDCHRQPPPADLEPVTVRCFFGCPAVVESADPGQAHDAMEAHYFDAHRADIRAAVGWLVPA